MIHPLLSNAELSCEKRENSQMFESDEWDGSKWKPRRRTMSFTVTVECTFTVPRWHLRRMNEQNTVQRGDRDTREMKNKTGRQFKKKMLWIHGESDANWTETGAVSSPLAAAAASRRRHGATSSTAEPAANVGVVSPEEEEKKKKKAETNEDERRRRRERASRLFISPPGATLSR